MAAYLYTMGKLYLNSQKKSNLNSDNLEKQPKISDLVNKTNKIFEENYETSFLEINIIDETHNFESDSDYYTSDEN